MKRLRFSYRCSGHRTQVMVGRGLAKTIADTLIRLKPYSLYFVSDSKTQGFASALAEAVGKRAEVVQLSLPRGERAKSLDHAERLSEAVLRHNPTRQSIIVAVGGGALGDVTGFVASLIMRGVRWVHCPTTLLAMVDASIGGKTAINSPRGKNLLGAFHQPEAVMVDIDTLATLSKTEIRAAFAEVIKIAATSSAKLFGELEACQDWFDERFIEGAVKRSLRLKAKVVEADEREAGKRRVLNFGHTIGHAIEEYSEHKIRHGEAVGIGIAIESRIAQARGKMPAITCQRIERLLIAAGLERALPSGLRVAKLEALIGVDKKRDGEGIPMPIPFRIGAYRELILTPREAAEAALRC